MWFYPFLLSEEIWIMKCNQFPSVINVWWFINVENYICFLVFLVTLRKIDLIKNGVIKRSDFKDLVPVMIMRFQPG